MRKKLCMLCLRYPGLNALLMRRTLPELRENHIIPLQQDLNGIATYNVTERVFNFPNGSRLKLGYCDSESDVLQYQGQEYPVIGMEEATHFTETQMQFMTTCNRKPPPGFTTRMYYTCNPGNVGHAWVKRLFIDREYRGKERPDDYIFIPAKVWDNKVLLESDPDYIRQLENLPADMRRAHLDGDWNVFAGMFFTGWRPEKHVIRPFPIPEHWLRFRAIDYGLDRLVCLWGAADEYGNLFIYDEYAVSDKIISEAAAGILARSTGREICTYAPTDLTARSRETGVARSETFAQCGLPLNIINNSRVQGWNNMAEWLKITESGEPRLRIFNTCRELIECLPLLQHNDKDPDDVATEPHNITHAPDALRYMLDGRPPASAPIPVPRDPWEPPTVEEQQGSFFNFGR